MAQPVTDRLLVREIDDDEALFVAYELGEDKLHEHIKPRKT